MRSDPKEALQYVYTICLSEDQASGVGKEQVELAWELTRRIIVSAETGGVWEELVGGFKPDGNRFVSYSYFVSNCSLPTLDCRMVPSNTDCHCSN